MAAKDPHVDLFTVAMRARSRPLAGILYACALSVAASAQKPPVWIGYGNGFPQIVSSGQFVYAAWEDSQRTSTPRHDIYFNRSLDGGATWMPSSIRLDVGSPPGVSDSFAVRIAAEGPSVFVAWMDFRSSSTTPDIYFNRSLDAGTSWLPSDVRLDLGNAPGASSSWYPRIACSGSSVYVGWTEDANGNPDVYFNRSADSGSTWLTAPVRLDTSVLPGAGGAAQPEMAAAGTAIYVAWVDYRTTPGNGDVYFNRSLDSGLTWLPSDLRLNLGRPPGTAMAYNLAVAAVGPSVYAVWNDSLSYTSNADVYCNRSLDGGSNWLQSASRLDTGSPPRTSDSRNPQIAAAGGSVHVTWTDAVPIGSAPAVLYTRSQDMGTTWPATPIRIDAGSSRGSLGTNHPTIVATASSVHVAWSDAAPLHYGTEVHCNRSLDAGATWPSSDIRLSTGSPVGSWANAWPRITTNGSSVHVLWMRNSGVLSIQFALASGSQPYGPGTAGAGGIVPSLSGSGHAAIGGTFALDFAGGVGGAPGLVTLGAGTTSRVSVPWFGGTLLVQPSGPAQTLGVQLGGAPGAPGTGTASVSIVVPNNAALLGFNANFQGLFLDAGAAGGVSMTNGLELWIG